MPTIRLRICKHCLTPYTLKTAALFLNKNNLFIKKMLSACYFLTIFATNYI